jgi:SagB-type dehydrogenase family enzyme
MNWFDDADMPRDIRAYHQRTKHAPQRYALGPAFLDWESQPDPFRRFEGARTIRLPLDYDRPTPSFAALDAVAPEAPAPEVFDLGTLGLFLELALGLSAWKAVDGARWPLRNNPSSGNLHPTEAYLLLPAVAGIGDGPALYHYTPVLHALEERCTLTAGPALPPGTFLIGLSSVHWREAWKYGERAFRYCQHDVGHALGAMAYAAACLGWRVSVLPEPGDETVAALLGLDRADSCHRWEEEHPDVLAVVSPEPVIGSVALDGLTGEWHGTANRLSEDHDPWPAEEIAAHVTTKPVCPRPAAVVSVPAPVLPTVLDLPAGAVIRRRRSAVRMDGKTGIGRDAFFRILARTLPDPEVVPWAAFPWPARLSLLLFVHRVEGLTPGLYGLIRDPGALERLRTACDADFLWRAVADCPLPFYLLRADDVQRRASQLSCLQAIAGKGAFSLGMVADFARTLDEDGDWAYRRLHWEAGLIGQVLYLEAGAAGLSGTGIGCFFDNEVLETFGIDPAAMDWQTLYHFTIGGAVEDVRLQMLPAYFHLDSPMAED